MIDRMMAFLGSAVIVFSLFPEFMARGFRIPPSVGHVSAVTIGMTEQDKSQTEASKIWEDAIAAKGGRERLYGVSNMEISEASDYITHKGRRNQVRREELYVFPNKYWFFEDYASDIFGIRMHMYNYDTKVQYIGAPGSPETILESVTDRSKVPWLDNAVLFILLETKWLKPIPVSAKIDRLGGKRFDVLETQVNGRRVDFVFDQKSHLPVRVAFHNSLNNQTSVHSLRLKDYVKVKGIPVPQTIMLEDDASSGGKQSVKFNVEYDEKIFLKPPSKAGPEHWRPMAEP